MNENVKEIRKDLYKLRSDIRNESLKLRGVDIDKVKALEESIEKEHNNLIDRLHKIRISQGEARAKSQEKLMRIDKSALIKEANNKIQGLLKDYNLAYVLLCGCDYKEVCDFVYHGTEDEGIIIEDESGMNRVTVSGPYDANKMQAQPVVDINGNVPHNYIGQIFRYFVFQFKPGETRTYCIKPEIYLNGWWLIWPFNSGTCPPSDVINGRGTVWIKLRVQARQGEDLHEVEYVVVMEENIEAPGDREGPVYYITSANTKLQADLRANEHVAVIVSCEVYVETSNVCRAIVDLGSSPGFYFKVPKVDVGPLKKCFPWREGFVRSGALTELGSLIIKEERPKIDKDFPSEPDCLPGPCFTKFRPSLKQFNEKYRE
ncbi:MAG: hypothetical protein KGD73_13410 [Candidatus Lokiarchaeota archaeon]|nr:hypothetical protein [Candidatus Lokiarchaeota archaeon]